MIKVRRLQEIEKSIEEKEKVGEMPTTGKVDAKTGRDIYGAYVTIHVTSDAPIRLNGHFEEVLDMKFTLEEKNARKLVGTSGFLKLKYEDKE